jgi:lambda family phage portal protein
MLDRLRRLIGRAPAKRSLEAAGGGRRWPDAPASRDAASWAHAGAGTVAGRAQKGTLNNPHLARITEVLPGNLVGTGITPRPQHPSEGMRERLARDFSAWTDMADPEGRLDFYGLQAAAVRDMVVLGEALFGLDQDPATGAPQLRRLHPEQLDRAKTLRLEDGGAIVQGVEFAPSGRIRAYWLRPGAPGDALGGLPLTSTRFPASAVIHLFRPLVPGQVRGLSWFAPVLLSAHELDQLLDALLVRVKVAAMYVGSIVDMDGAGPGFDGTQTGSKLDTSVEPGAIRVEQPGKRLEWSEPPTTGDATALATETLRMIATGAGVTYEQLTGDYSKVNYSSARAALLEFRRFCDGIQHHTIVFQFCRPVWQRFVLWQVLRGVIPAAAFQADRMAFEAVKWLPPAWPWVDPLKDGQAAVLEMDNNLRSRSEVVAERGYDIEALDKEIAADRARAERLGIAPKETPPNAG